MALASAYDWHQTVDELSKASLQRFIDAERLKDRDRYLGAIYLAGYSVEMNLKVAFFHTTKWRFSIPDPTVINIAQLLTKARERATYFKLRVPANVGHDLQFWNRLVIEELNENSKSIIGNAEINNLRRSVAQLSSNWSSTMRYSSAKWTRKDCVQLLFLASGANQTLRGLVR